MADEFQTGVCGGNWWNSSRAMFGSSPYSSAINDVTSFGWSSELVDMKPKSSDESDSVSDVSMVFQDIQKPHQLGSDWNQTLLRSSGRSESDYHHPMLQEDVNSRLNYKQQSHEILDCPQIEKDWSSNNLSFNGFKPINQAGFSLDEPSLNPYPSKLLQSLFDTDPHEQSLYTNQLMSNINPSITNYAANTNEFSSISFPKFSPNLSRPSSLPKQQQSSNHFQLKNNTTPFWKSNAAALDDIRASFFPSTQSQLLGSTFEDKPNFLNLTAKPNSEEVRDSSSAVKKSSIEPAFKRPRIETPSPLPTFKVRKEKLGDRITALQQLVSPFGKTDTASVLHEAIEYIKFLHDQVNVLSTPYMKNGAPNPYQQSCDKLKDNEGPKQDLRSRGLCLVPVSSTFPVTNETTHDLWPPTFGGSFR